MMSIKTLSLLSNLGATVGEPEELSEADKALKSKKKLTSLRE